MSKDEIAVVYGGASIKTTNAMQLKALNKNKTINNETIERNGSECYNFRLYRALFSMKGTQYGKKPQRKRPR